jgi:hypothetical protein
VQDAAQRGGLKGAYGVRRIEPQASWFEQLLLQLDSSASRMLVRLGLGSLSASVNSRQSWPQSLTPIEQGLMQELARWGHLSSPNAVYAYCFCGVQGG